MLTIKHKTKEVDITVNLIKSLGSKPKISIYGTADLTHHLIEGIYEAIDKISRVEEIEHGSKSYMDKQLRDEKFRIEEI